MMHDVERDAQAIAHWALNEEDASEEHVTIVYYQCQKPEDENEPDFRVKSTCGQKVYAALASLQFHRRSLSFTLKTQLIKFPVIPQFDYASIVYMNVDKT